MMRSVDDIQGMLHVRREHGQNLQKDVNMNTAQHTLNVIVFKCKIQKFQPTYFMYNMKFVN
jgi:hypothetical protein